MAEDLDKLLILNKIAPGLFNRVHRMINFSDVILNEETSFQKKLESSFPQLDKYDQIDAAQRFKDKSQNIITATKDYYDTIVDVINFTEETWKVLKQMSGTQLVRHDFDYAIDMMEPYLALLTNSIKLNFLFSYVKGDEKQCPPPTRVALQ